jgi:primosomal protein N' (replication factor Y)
MTQFADILLPLPLPKLFVYRVPRHMELMLQPLIRVIVPFGKKKRYTGIVHRIHNEAPRGHEARYIEDVLDEQPCIDATQLRFWEWMASYYLCGLGDVMQAALPSVLKLSSESIIRISPEAEEQDMEGLSERQMRMLEAVQHSGALNLQELAQAAGIKTILPTLRGLMDRKLLVAEEEIKDVFRPRKEVFLCLHPHYQNEKNLHRVLDSMRRAPRQEELLLAYLSMQSPMEYAWVSRKELQQKAPAAIIGLQGLLQKGVFVSESRVVSRLGGGNQHAAPFNLSAEQEEAISVIRQGFDAHKTVLLHGQTGSGKTELYIRLMEEQLADGKQVLYLLPEIALTSQIILRLRAHFGAAVQVYHSRFSEQERMEVWNAVAEQDEKGQIILGARSSVFLPYRKLGLVIVDEEHDPSFKQNEPAPRYHGRDAAMVLASMHKARVLLGSATPSLESYHHAREGKYHLCSLLNRYGGSVLPDIWLDDLKEATKKTRIQGSFGPLLLKTMKEKLEAGRQIILFRNRRGFAPMLECARCQWIPHCVQCDISLTYHKSLNQLRCHYCGYSMNLPSQCRDCGSTDIRMKGFGTEKLEEEIATHFPDASVARMDLDTTRSKSSYHKIIEDFRERRTEILVGTQMLSKGLDFEGVQLVGVLSADAMLNYPDFRSYERSFQLLSQVAGRAGRRQEPGVAVIQTWNTDHPVLEWVRRHDYQAFFEHEIAERRRYGYPPFSRLIKIVLRHEAADQLDPAADLLGQALRIDFGNRILGPEYPPVAKVRNQFQKNILLKLEQGIALPKVKNHLQEVLRRFFEDHPLKGFRVILDVDPA